MRILVTGSEGFLGQHLVSLLIETGYEVIPFDIKLGDELQTLQSDHPKFDGIDVCIHLAAVSDLYIADDDPDRTHVVNVVGTQRIAKACEFVGARLLFASTCCAYGNNGWSLNTEEAPLSPTEVYAESKVQAEQVLQTFQIPIVIMRIGTFYGPGQRDSLMTEVFPRQAATGGSICIHGDGNQTRALIHVEDVCRGILCLVEKPSYEGAVNIASATSVSVNECAHAVAYVADVSITYINDRQGQIRQSNISVDILKSLGWYERYDVLSFLKRRTRELADQFF